MVSLFFTKPAAADNDSSSYISQQVEHRWYWLISLKLTTDTSFPLHTKDPNPLKFTPKFVLSHISILYYGQQKYSVRT